MKITITVTVTPRGYKSVISGHGLGTIEGFDPTKERLADVLAKTLIHYLPDPNKA